MTARDRWIVFTSNRCARPRSSTSPSGNRPRRRRWRWLLPGPSRSCACRGSLPVPNHAFVDHLGDRNVSRPHCSHTNGRAPRYVQDVHMCAAPRARAAPPPAPEALGRPGVVPWTRRTRSSARARPAAAQDGALPRRPLAGSARTVARSSCVSKARSARSREPHAASSRVRFIAPIPAPTGPESNSNRDFRREGRGRLARSEKPVR